jgi:hypothetical protein
MAGMSRPCMRSFFKSSAVILIGRELVKQLNMKKVDELVLLDAGDIILGK